MTLIEPVRVRITQCFVRLLSQAVFFSLFWPVFCIAAHAPDLQRVLVLYSEERLLPSNVILDHSLRTNLEAGASKHIEFYSEFLDVPRVSGEVHQEQLREFLREKYRNSPLDLIIAVSGPAAAFLLKFRADLFAGAPVVYVTYQREAPPTDLLDPKAGVISIPDGADATLRLALDLQQDTRSIAVVSGSSQRDKLLTEELRNVSSAFTNRIAFTWLTDLSLPELRDKLARLPDHTVVFYLTLFQDAAGNRFRPREALDQFAPASHVPIYGLYDTYLGHGIVGGSMVTFEEIGREVARAGLRILAGETPQDVARSEIAQPIPMFDWRELRRWNISENQLPPTSVVLFKEASYWEKHLWVILGVVAASLVEALLIAVLFVQLRRRRQVEAFLRESEERLNLATTSAGAGLWAIDQPTRKIWLTERARQLFGLSAGKAPDWDQLWSAIHPADRKQMRNSIEEALSTGKEFVAEFRVVSTDGSSRWISSRGRTQFGSHVKLQRLMGACVDITERKRAEEETRRHFQELVHITRVSLAGELSGSLIHELGQPLGAILTNSEVAEMHLKHANPDLDEVRAIFFDLRMDAIRASEVVGGMRAFLRGQEVDFKTVDLGSLMGALEKIAGPDVALRGATLAIGVAANLPPVWGHPIQLQQVLLNLVLNGLEAMKDGSYDEHRISVTASPYEESFVEIAVADTGHGLPPDKLDQVFAPFITSKPTGLGVGLSICRRIIEAHGGRIWIQNNASCGATARVILPTISASPS